MKTAPLLPVAVLLLAQPLSAQGRQVVAELGASSVLPPLGVEGSAASYLMGGVRGEWMDYFGDGVSVSLLGGRTTDSALGGDFLSGEVAGFETTSLGDRWAIAWEGRLSGFTVSSPYPYRAWAAEGQVEVRMRSGPVRTALAGTGGWGGSEVDLFRYLGGPVVTVDDELWRYGATLEALGGSSAVAAGVSAGYHNSAGGVYRSLGGRLVLGIGGGAVELRLDRWDTPVGAETTGGLALVVPFGRWTLRGFGGRSEPDPLTLAEPGRGGGGVLLGVRLLGEGSATGGGRTPLYEVVGAGEEGVRVRVRVHAPDAAAVQVLGDFSLWDPIDMTREREGWTVEVTVAPGTYHFGFNVDGEWYLPDDAPDAVPDEWGRKSATMVVEE